MEPSSHQNRSNIDVGIEKRCFEKTSFFFRKKISWGEMGVHRTLRAGPDPPAGGGRGRVEQIEGGPGDSKWRSGGATIEVRRVWDVFWAVLSVWINL